MIKLLTVHTYFLELTSVMYSKIQHRDWHILNCSIYTNRIDDQCSHQQKTISTSERNVTGDGRVGTTGGIVGRKRSSPTSQTDSYKISRPLVRMHVASYECDEYSYTVATNIVKC